MLQKIVWILILGFLGYLGLKGHLDVPIEKARTSMWVSTNMASAGTDGKVFRNWLESRGFATREMDENIVMAKIGASRVSPIQADHYWTCTVTKKRPLGEMNLVLYVAENPRGSYLEYWSRSSIQDKR